MSAGHIAYMLAKLAIERELPVDVAEDDEHGAALRPNPFKGKLPVAGEVETDEGDDDEK